MQVMPQMVVRNIDKEVQQGLRKLAERNGVSVEEQVRRILAAAVAGGGERPSAGQVLRALRERFPEARLEEGEIVELRSPIRPVDFS